MAARRRWLFRADGRADGPQLLSAATGIVLAIALIRGFARGSGRSVGNFWVDVTRCTLYVLLPISCVSRWSSSGRACRRRSGAMSMLRPWKAPIRPSPRGQSRRRSSSRRSAPMAAASLTPMRRILRESERAVDQCPDHLEFALGAALTNGSAGSSATCGRAGPCWVMGILFLCGVVVSYWAESAGNPAFAKLGVDQAYRRPGRRQYGGQGGPLRDHQFLAVCRDHHRRLVRRGQFDARFVHARSAA